MSIPSSGRVITSLAMVIAVLSGDVTNAISSCPSSNSVCDNKPPLPWVTTKNRISFSNSSSSPGRGDVREGVL